MNTTTYVRTRKPRNFRTGFNGELACPDRNSSVCPECFATTPGLIDVFSEVYLWDPSEWAANTYTETNPKDIANGLVNGLTLSPGTVL